MSKIIVIEDEKAVLENILEIIEEFDFEAIGFSNGNDALEKIKSYKPDLIICDIMMPEIDGFDVLKSVQKNPATATIPFIFLTAKADKEDLRTGMDLGADDYLTKPFSPDQLYKAINARLNRTKTIKSKSEEKMRDLRMSLATILPHEFRTPLNGILSSSQFLMEYFDTLEKSDIESLHENIYSSAQRLHHLIINYLTYADLELLDKDEEKKAGLSEFETDLSEETIRLIFERNAEKYSRKEDLELDICEGKVQMVQDHFAKICDEISDNALKFSEEHQKITIKTESDGDFYCITVKDFGRGMTAEEVAAIGAYIQFNRKVYEQQGSGLGLSIAKKITHIYGGKFELNSEIGKGTTVKLKIPLKK